MQTTDIAIIGGGIIGLATGYRITERFPGKKIVLFEKEAELAHHQSGRNSGVLHSGMYYKPGSLKAANCRAGKQAMEAFCRREGIAFEICGKVIVAVDASELERLNRIFERGTANGVKCEIIGRDRLVQLEPHTAGIRAIHVPEAGIVDYKGVSERLRAIICERGGEIRTRAPVTAIHEREGHVVVESPAGEVEAQYLINCAGLHSDRVATMTGHPSDAKIVPFRGEFYELKPSAQHLCRNLIYPVPDPTFPFLGVHFTRLALGGVECGPNAVLAFAREGYRKTDVNLRDLFESLTYPGFLRMTAKHWKMGLGEMWRSISKRAFVAALQRLMPEIRADNLEPAPSGVRAQALSRDGNLVDDFLIETNDRVINVINAPSPAATAALNIGQIIVDKLQSRL
ncbi:MAG: L-2-hydroxyglutarate oxidase [Planctomycetaceae bacterium]